MMKGMIQSLEWMDKEEEGRGPDYVQERTGLSCWSFQPRHEDPSTPAAKAGLDNDADRHG